MSQNQGWGQPPSGSGWGQQPPPGSPPGGAPPAGDQPPQWGAPPPPNQSGWPSKYCQACGSIIDARAVDCPRCGVRQSDTVYQEPKSRPLAILLALLLGSFGIHRFYVGPISWGVAYLIFFWTGIPGFLAWLEALYWLTRNDVEWAQKYGGPARQSNGAAIGCLWVLALLPLLLTVLVFVLVLVGATTVTIFELSN
jgi:TM2 domain-containing membrane protein YozV